MSMPPAKRRSTASIAISWSTAIARTATATCWRCDGPEELAARHHATSRGPATTSSASAPASITQWAYALPGQLATGRGRVSVARARSAKRVRHLISQNACQSCAAALPKTSRLRRSPGFVSAVRRRCCSARRTKTTSPIFSQICRAEIPVTVIGLGSNLIVRDGGVPGVVIRLGRGFGEVTVTDGPRIRAGAAVPDMKLARAAPGRRHRRTCVLSRYSRRHRRRLAHERRRQWRRDQGRADRGARRRPARQYPYLQQCRDGLQLPPFEAYRTT